MTESINLINSEDFCGDSSEKKLYLIQLPKELSKIKDLKFNFNNLKNGSIVEIVRFNNLKMKILLKFFF
jgi:hypothetical protein